ncbi:hypothetical protein SeMB42_g07324 [Synchytrium endobioticum]|uniref:Uncharacterized protein n=1 Tax=Synchytrium endobioticum TaxID=286115 RepID=A0A507C8W0_9FUNG|nr:hypothetical protein SeMB42_g07324 [Synchytrium endobioticum]TPX42109.1 hypothetical protein SeLEV6574_g05754 [Synchytrium endobioticum]
MADADLLRQLFQENNDLKVKVNALTREIFNRSVQYDNAEEEIRLLTLKLDQTDKTSLRTDPSKPTDSHRVGDRLASHHSSRASVADTLSSSKELQETIRLLDKRNSELKQIREDLSRAHSNVESLRADKEKLEKETAVNHQEIRDLQAYKLASLRQAVDHPGQPKDIVASVNYEEFAQTKLLLSAAERSADALKKQLLDLANEANRKYNDQQNQLQGADALIESIRREYDEFIQIAKLENEAMRETQLADYNVLKMAHDRVKIEALAERKRVLHEYQTILYSLQAQFEEYRVTSEFVYNTDMAKLADAIKSQGQRYEHQLLYVIQAKDKFYSYMMVAKDAKIMSLIQGSDMQSIMQKHEMETEALRKEHLREIDRVRQEQDSEQKSLVALLQRQSANLDAKCDKLQQHAKALESRLRDMMATVETKNRQLVEKEEVRLQQELDFTNKWEDAQRKNKLLTQEKEHLRHRIIRMNLDARGEGDNSLDSTVKRLTRETARLQSLYDDLASKYETTLAAEHVATKRAKEKEKVVDYLEKECARRTAEYQSMVRTFEEFLQRRAKQGKDDAARRMRLHSSSIPANPAKLDGITDSKGVIKAHIPKLEDAPAQTAIFNQSNAMQRSELERGYTYLRRFKTLSRAFATGDLRAVHLPGASPSAESIPGPWQKIPLYKQLDSVSLAIAKIYEPLGAGVVHNGGPDVVSTSMTGVGDDSIIRKKIPVYAPDTSEIKARTKTAHHDVKLYSGKDVSEKVEQEPLPPRDKLFIVSATTKK